MGATFVGVYSLVRRPVNILTCLEWVHFEAPREARSHPYYFRDGRNLWTDTARCHGNLYLRREPGVLAQSDSQDTDRVHHMRGPNPSNTARETNGGIHRSALAGSPAQHLLISSLIGPFSTLLGFQYGLLTAISAALSTSPSAMPKSFSPLLTSNFSNRTFKPLVASPLLPGRTKARLAIASGIAGAL